MSVKPNPVFDPATPPPAITVAPALEVAAAPSPSAEPDSPAAYRPRRRLPAMTSRYLVRVAALLMALVVWHFAASSGFNFFINFENVPTPLLVGEALVSQLSSSEFYLHIVHSMERIAIAYAYAVVLGVLAGVMMGRSRWAEDIILPYIELFRPIPAVAWIPLAILMLPTEQSSIVFITFLGAFFPIVLNTVHGVEQTPDVLVRAARSLGASKRAILWHVVIPGAMPSIVAGLAIGMGVAWFSLLAGEIISGQYGIGYFTWTSYTLVKYPEIIIGMLTIGGLGTLCTLLVRKACAPLLHWQAKGGRP
ncbi:ABC transporter permease [Stutzerimonas stutzeri]|uniref:ABC transporter permease n=1 Tax=Stutzerimonas stutzeri TaxID=316 RepID=UPI00371DADE6